MAEAKRPAALRLGIIGTGVAANDLFFPALGELRGAVEVVAVANRRRAKAVAFAKRLGGARVHDSGEALLRDPAVEAVLLLLPIHLTASWVLASLRAGKHVLSEKPVAASVAEGKRLVKQAKRYDRVWLVGENFFFTPHIARARDWVREGELGEVRLVEASQLTRITPDNKYYRTSWRQSPRHAGGFVLDSGVHLANVLREMFGTPKRVLRLTAGLDPRLPPIDTAVAAFDLEGGALGVWKSCFSLETGDEVPMLRAYGSRANIEVYYARSLLLPHGRRPKTATSPHDGFYAELAHFRACVRGRDELRFRPEDALADLDLIERIVR